jgi:hypothetical protein
MGTNDQWFLSHVVVDLSFSTLLIMSKLCLCDIQYIGTMPPGMAGSQANFIDEGSKFLLSNNRNFAFGFVTTVNAIKNFGQLVDQHYQFPILIILCLIKMEMHIY